MKNMKKNKSARKFYAYMEMADRFNLSEDNKKRLITILNEPTLDDFDFVAISDQQASIVSLFGISPEEYGAAFSKEYFDKAMARDKIASN